MSEVLNDTFKCYNITAYFIVDGAMNLRPLAEAPSQIRCRPRHDYFF